MAGIDLSGSIFADRRQRNRRKYSPAQQAPGQELRGGGERRCRNGLFAVSDRAWWLKVNYLDRNLPQDEDGEQKTGS